MSSFHSAGWAAMKRHRLLFQALRSPDGRYRTEPLRGLWDVKKMHKGGFYHDGRFATLMDVVDHYDRHFNLNLSQEQKQQLVEYLKSL